MKWRSHLFVVADTDWRHAGSRVQIGRTISSRSRRMTASSITLRQRGRVRRTQIASCHHRSSTTYDSCFFTFAILKMKNKA